MEKRERGMGEKVKGDMSSYVQGAGSYEEEDKERGMKRAWQKGRGR